MEYLAFFGITGWLPLAYYNVYKQDRYLTPFTVCNENKGDVCEVTRARNMFISRALRAVKCPKLGRKDSPCAREKRGILTWFMVACFLLVGTISSISVFKNINNYSGNYNFLVPSVISVAISLLLFGLLRVPYGTGPHESKKIHLRIAISAFALMIVNSFYLSFHSGKTSMYVLSILLCVSAVMAGTSEAIVDNNVPTATEIPHKWYGNKQWHRRLIDSLFQLGENLPVIFYGLIILVAAKD